VRNKTIDPSYQYEIKKYGFAGYGSSKTDFYDNKSFSDALFYFNDTARRVWHDDLDRLTSGHEGTLNPEM
jgi:hypothetical protein